MRAPAVEMKPSTSDRLAQGGAAEDETRDAADLEAADLREHVEGVGGVGTVHKERVPDDGDLVLDCASSMPVPRPVISSTLLSVNAATMAALGVVLPMPMSPVPNRSVVGEVAHDLDAGFDGADGVGAAHGGAGGHVRGAGGDALVHVFRRRRARSDRRRRPCPRRRPRAPARRARALMPAPPFTKLKTICAVTSCGYLLTPEAVTP